MSDLFYEDKFLRSILENTKTIAMVGASAKEERPSFQVMEYLKSHGLKVIPVNPGLAGQKIQDETVYASLSDIDVDFDMVDIFRSSDAVGPIVEEAIALKNVKSIQTVWMQQGVINEEAAKQAADAGFHVVMDHCPKKEYRRLYEQM